MNDTNFILPVLVGLALLLFVYLWYLHAAVFSMRDQVSAQVKTISKVESLTSEVYELATLDQLTGLCNRRSGEQRLAEEISRSIRHGRPLTAMLLDMDGLKQINDQYGHAAGDVALKSFAERILKATRGSDLAVRLGGDEFMVLLPECRASGVKYVHARVEGLEIEYNRVKIPCRFSSGWTEYKEGETSQEFLKRADEALYENKRANKETVSDPFGSRVPQPT